MKIRARHMGIAIGAAVAIHVVAALAMVLEPEPKGAASTGVGGLQISLGPSGGAPGTAAPVESEVEKPDPVEPPVAQPDTAPPPPVQASEPPPPPAPAEMAVEKVEVVEQVDEVIAIAEPEKVQPAPPPEPVKIERPQPPEKPVEVKPEPVEVARVEPEVPPIETPPLPVQRPTPPKPQPQKPEPQVAEKPQPEQTAVAAVQTPAAEAAPAAPAQPQGSAGRAGIGSSQQSGTAESTSGGGRPGVTADYASILQAWLEEHKEYPRRARSRRQEGVVMLFFVMDRDGYVLNYRIDRSSGYDLLDREVEEMIQRAQPLPPLPAEMTQARLELVVPVQFQLR